MKKITFVLFLAISGITLPAQSPRSFVTDSIDSYVEGALEDWKIPGVSVCIVKDGKLVLAKGYGVRRWMTDEKVDENSLFMIGSNTKAFTATALAMLSARGKMSLDDKVVKWWPSFSVSDPWVTKEVNIRDLLSHRMGYETFQGDFMFFDSNLKQAEVFEKFSKLKPLHGFRSKWGYTNAAFAVAGEVVRLVSGKTWANYLKDEIFSPLGMSRTTPTVFDLRMASNIAFPHTVHEDKIKLIAFGNLEGLAPAGSISSSAIDISKWMLAQLQEGKIDGKQVIPASAIAATWEPHSILGNGGSQFNRGHFALYGLGWFLEEYAGRKIVSHTGGVNGYVTSVTLLPEENLGIAVFTNTDQNNFFENLKWEIIDAYLDLPYRDYSQHSLKWKQGYDSSYNQQISLKRDTVMMNLKTTLPLASYAGWYEHDIYGGMDIKVEGKSLKVKFQHHSLKELTLEPLGGNRFLSTWNDPLYGNRVIYFNTEGDKVRSMIFRVAGFIENTSYEFFKLK
jgi:CubicO group peptidase (beta-lactamase class C family)